MSKLIRVLGVEDSEDDALLVIEELRSGGYDPTFERVETHEAMEAALDKGGWDLIISDYAMPHFCGLAALQLMQKKKIDLPFIVVSGTIGEDVAVEMMKAGAHDYLMKGNLVRLCSAIAREIREAENRAKRKQIEDALKVSEEKFRTISATANDAIIMVDNEGKISYWNEAAEEIFGFSKKEAIGKDISNTIIPERLREDHLRGFKKFSETGQGAVVGKTVELIAIRKDGSKIPIELSLSAIRLKGKWNAVSIIRDITERKKDEDILWQRVNELTALNRLSQQVSASLALDQVVKVALDGITAAIDPDLTLFFLRDGDELYLQGEISKISKHKQDETIVHRVGECLCGLVVSEKKPIYSSDICSDPRCTWGECKKSGLRSFAGFPLWGRDEIIGVLGMASVTPKKFEKQNTFLETLSNEISFALQNALLHMQLEQHTKDLEDRVADRTKELAQINTNLEGKNVELERFNDLFVNREFRIKELKEKIKELEGRLVEMREG